LVTSNIQQNMNQLLSKYDDCNFEAIPGRPVSLDLRKVEKVYRQCQKENVKLDVPTGSFIIKELAKFCRAKKNNCKKWRSFLDEIYQEMKLLGLIPLQISLNCMIDMYGTCNEFNNMFSLFEEMIKNENVDTVTFNCILKHASTRSIKEMMKYYDLMKKINISPCEKTFNILIFGVTKHVMMINSDQLFFHIKTILADLHLHPAMNSNRVTSFLLKRLSKFESSEVNRAVQYVEKYRTAPENYLTASSLLFVL
jgi:pentatricopeptide repeat protein